MKRQAKEAMLEMASTYEGGASDGLGGALVRARSAVQDVADTSLRGLPLLEPHHELFDELTLRHYIRTHDKAGQDVDVISMVVSYDSAYLVAACSSNDESFNIIGYSLGTFQEVFNHEFRGEFMKVKVIEQNYEGNVFVVAYQDDGKFHVSFLEPGGQVMDSLDVSATVPLDSESKPVTGFSEPLIAVAVLPDGSVFVSAYHRYQKKQYYFMYQHKNEGKGVKEGKVIAGPMSREIDDGRCTGLNFPIKSFYSEKTGKCTTFYRQGYCVTVDAKTMESSWERIIEADLGDMYLLFDAALVTRSSGSILFFRLDEETVQDASTGGEK